MTGLILASQTAGFHNIGGHTFLIIERPFDWGRQPEKDLASFSDKSGPPGEVAILGWTPLSRHDFLRVKVTTNVRVLLKDGNFVC